MGQKDAFSRLIEVEAAASDEDICLHENGMMVLLECFCLYLSRACLGKTFMCKNGPKKVPLSYLDDRADDLALRKTYLF